MKKDMNKQPFFVKRACREINERVLPYDFNPRTDLRIAPLGAEFQMGQTSVRKTLSKRLGES
jgi:DNA-binding GntR family transcriptional regulator